MATRRERVVLELDDQFTAGILRAAAATKVADGAMGDFGDTYVRTTKSLDTGATATNRQAKSLNDLDMSARRAERSGSLLGDALVGLGPALLPIGALAVPAVAGLAAQMGFAAAAGGTMILALHGVGDSLKALDAYQLAPTAANLEKLNESMAKLSPAGRDFVHELDRLEPKLKSLKAASEGGLLPGLSQGLEALTTRLPQVRQIIATVSGATGGLAADAGRSLAGGDYDEFFNYLQTNAKPILDDLGRTVGNLTLGLAHMFTATAPEQREFSDWLLGVSRDFEHWADGLDESEGFTRFMDYVHQTGPQVASTLGAVGNAFVSILKAGAPLGGPLLKGLEALANIIDRIASSPLGTPLVTLASGLALVNRALATRDLARGSSLASLLYGTPQQGGGRGPNAIAQVRAQIRGLSSDVRAVNSVGLFAGTKALASPAELEKSAAAAGRLRGNLATLGKGAAAAGGLALATSGLADNMGLANTASYALMGTLAGPWGAAVGGAVGLTMDLAHANDDLKSAVESANKALDAGDAATTESLISKRNALRQQLAEHDKNLDSSNPFDRPKAALADIFGVTRNARQSLSSLNDAVDTRRSRAALDELTRGFVLTAAGADAAGRSIEEWSRQTNRAMGQINAQAAFDAYKQSIQDATDALKQNGRTLDVNSSKGRGNRAALRGIATDALAVAENLKGAGRIDFLSGARQSFIKAARAAGATRAEAKRLADAFGLLDGRRVAPEIKPKGVDKTRSDLAGLLGLADSLGRKRPRPRVSVLDNASGPLAGIIDMMNRLHDKTVVVNTITKHSGGNPAAPILGKADGGWHRGPGGPRDDAILARVSDGEFTMNARSAAKYARELEYMNANPYANGGWHGSAPASSLSLEGLTISGTLDTPWGPAEVHGIATRAAQKAVNDSADMDRQSAMAGGGSGY